MVNYCKECILPNTRPGIFFNEDGVCSGCIGHKSKKNIDWQNRENQFETILRMAKEKNRQYNCVIPVSGGKDSTWQVVTCLKRRLKILAVTWKTAGRTEIGQKNLNNLIRLGVDHVDYTINPEIEKRFILKTLEEVGDASLPMHMAIYSIPLRIAVHFNIPLIIWGESPHLEYGGDEEERLMNQLNHQWFKRHSILQGTTVDDWIGPNLSSQDLSVYAPPTELEFKQKEILSLFLGFYFKWDPKESLAIAQKHGFQTRLEGPKTGLYNYADIDCDFISVHHHFKWLKFGFTRLFDNLSLEIRNGRMTRTEAIQVVRNRKDQTPHGDIERLCQYLNISIKYFREIEEKFRNKKIWVQKNGKWEIPNFIINEWEWQ